MKIYNTSGVELTERPDYSKGRLLQSKDDPEKYIFSPWDEVPLRDEENPSAVPENPSDGERLSSLEESQEEQNEVLDTLLTK